MDFSSSLRRKQTAVTYGKRNRSANSSPAVARTSVAAASSSSGSSDDDGPVGPSDTQKRLDLSPSSPTRVARSNSSPKDRAAALPITQDVSPLSRSVTRPTNGTAPAKSPVTTPSGLAPTPKARSALTSTPLSASGIFPKPGSSSTNSLPHRPSRAASPTATKSAKASSSAIPLKRSASASPRKLQSSSVSPSKRRTLSRTPSRPAQDLASLFDAIEPTLPQARSPFARSESQPVVRLHQDEVEAEGVNTPLQSPTHASFGFEDELLSPGTSSPSKRQRMADRMAPRAARSTKSKVDQIAEALSNSRRGSLRRIETAPEASLADGSNGPFALDEDRSDSLKAADNGVHSTKQSDAGSTRIDTASHADSQSQEGVASVLGARRLAGIKQNVASNAKRTYGLQRSFLADQAEENLLTEPAVPSAKDVPRNIEDEIEAELNSKASTTRPALPPASRLADSTPSAPRESYAELLKKWGEGADDIEWDESQDPTLSLKSITSLRSQGELRRFNDDLEYLFSGLDTSQTLSIRKSSAVELVRLLCGKPDVGSLNDDDEEVEDGVAAGQSAEFIRKLKASDLVARLFDLFRGAEAGEGVDDVLDVVMGVYLGKMVKTASSAEALMRERSRELQTTLRGLLIRANRAKSTERKDGWALLRLHELGLGKIASRSDRKTLSELRGIARTSKLFVAGAKSWTLRNLVLASCCSLIVLPRRLLGDAAITDLLIDSSAEDGGQESLFATVLNVLILEGAEAQQRVMDFSKGLELITREAVEAVPDLETLDVALRFLDKAMDVLYLELDQAVPATGETLEAMQNLICFAIQASPFDLNSEQGGGVRALQVLHSLLKTLLDLSQVDPNWSKSLASSQVLQMSVVRAFLLSHSSASQLRTDPEAGLDVGLFDDVLHLSLALLTNLLIKQGEKARDTLELVELSPTCWGRRSCTLGCGCEEKLPALQLLARVFFETRHRAAEGEGEAGYLSNSVATALAQFAVGGNERLERIRKALEKELPKGERDGLEVLLGAVEEFALVHEAALVSAEKGEKEGAGETEDEEVERGQIGDVSNPIAREAGELIRELGVRLGGML